MATDFRSICNVLANTSCSEQKLNIIKYHFREEIDSARRFDRIPNLKELIKILQKRDVLNPDDNTSLKYLLATLDRTDLLVSNNTPASQESAVIKPRIKPPLYDRVLPEVSDDPIKRVDDIICCNIGKKWNEFARQLKIPEGFIDQLEHKHNQIGDMVHEILVYHRKVSDERYWKIKLCQALENARRKDLSRDVQEEFAKHGFMYL
ncbi:hypothetical protein NQ317_001320 [Molorchus minor]|uniref:FADD n=1 Tax=Molorchus minor TaxID=1323400 RepID=A0ABQ9J8D2_9CUCU|nr:hypothetical protein NQ317_001320 [Molorchus minor]